MSMSQRDRRLIGAFIVGAAIGPAALGLAGLWLTIAPPPPCTTSFLCFRGLTEALLSLLAVAVAAGILAQILARDVIGWLTMVGGIVAMATVYSAVTPPAAGAEEAFILAIVVLGVPATAAYLVARAGTWLAEHTL